MIEHKCPTCEKIYNKKNDYIRHINKKRLCKKKIKNEIPIEIDYDQQILSKNILLNTKKEINICNNDEKNILNTNNVINNDNEGYVYLLQIYDLIKNCNIYKIGKTKRYAYDRMKEYTQGMKILVIENVSDRNIIENNILLEFNKNSKIIKCEKGNEYFLCDDTIYIKNKFKEILSLDNSQQIIQTININVLNNTLNTLKTLSNDIEILKESNNELKEKVKESNNEIKENNNELKENNNELNKKIKRLIEYTCDKCGKKFNNKTDFTRHNDRKNSCKKKIKINPINLVNTNNKTENIIKIPILDNNDEILQNKNVDILDNNQQIIQTINIDVLNNILNTLKILSKDIELLKEKNDELKESNNILQTQVKESNNELKEKVKESNNELKKSNNEFNKKIKTLEESNDKIIKKVSELNNPTNIKMINNITINIIAFGNEDLNFINNECVKKLLYKGFESIQNYVTMVHFNKEKPEYQNIYISNKRNKNEIMVNDGNK
jgi:uncharacterized C2H2 Zn-finger protein